jgi:hypothetical protein
MAAIAVGWCIDCRWQEQRKQTSLTRLAEYAQRYRRDDDRWGLFDESRRLIEKLRSAKETQ